jgi:glycosyltransferase involved in cell wall biosynthesis
MIENLTVIVPSHNTLNHLKNTYDSIRRFYPTVKLIIIDDASTDGTDVWLSNLTDNNLRIVIDKQRKGHTYWYDEGMRMSDTDICAILHSDMMIGPLYFENQLKHLKPRTVVCATRVEPPIHPEGLEKIVKNFGMDYFDFDQEAFDSFCTTVQESDKDKKTKGIFAPWLLFKEDHLRIGGHDQNFAPYGYEDSDIFNRWILAGYEMVQSRDALVYHLTCRGHRWNKGVGIENSDYKDTMRRGQRYFIRKWNQWIQNDELMMPIIHPKYNTCLVLKNVDNIHVLMEAEPWTNKVYVDNKLLLEKYIELEQPNSKIDLKNRMFLNSIDPDLTENDVYIILDCNKLRNEDFQNLIKINQILSQLDGETNVVGTYEIDNITIKVNRLKNIINELVNI